MVQNIHPTAIVEASVQLGSNVKIGPFCYITGNVVIGDNCKIDSHVVIRGSTVLGNNNIVFPFAVIGSEPQDLKYVGEESRLEIGNNNVIREHVTIHSGTNDGNKNFADKSLTKIGNNCLLMVASHIAHDCFVGDYVILANNATLAGHVMVSDYVIIGGLSAVKQFVRIGEHSIIGGMSGVEKDVIPFGLIIGERANLSGINIVGLKRRNFALDSIKSLQKMYQALFKASDLVFSEKLKEIRRDFTDKHVLDVIDFIEADNANAICSPKSK
ncbi:MAG: acyl-ACP--UDP-N-acetylglucosamine O-acyltransferase [Rickettsiales bacterium]|jgi:UDP-N-acetylglucosamine acyltransferase|nr:acyl-ACP--UDP-N-acetylglucosamine O-acyltransferase [Rickettsiales bacterium]